MTARLFFVVPGRLETRTGGSIYDCRIIDALRARGRDVEVIELAGTYPFPAETDRALADSAVARIPDGAIVIADGLALGALPDLAEREGARLCLVALVHHPLADEAGLSAEQRAGLEESERRALASAKRVTVTSNFTCRRLADYGVAANRIRVVTPGADAAALAERSIRDEMVLLCPASLIPRKGHQDLFRALAGLPELRWRLVCAGKDDLDPEWAAGLRESCATLGLGNRVEFRGEVGEAEMEHLYAEADLVVLASHYEGYGMVVGEAIARGVPVVTTTGGALAETLPDGAGLASEPCDITGLRDNLRRVLSDRMLYERLALGARAARNTIPSWAQAAEKFEAALAGT